MHSLYHRVVITGMGAVSPLGECIDEYLAALRSGRSGIAQWQRTDGLGFSKIGGDMSSFDLKAHLDSVGATYPDPVKKIAQKLLRTTPLSGQLTAAAALQAYCSSGLSVADSNATPTGHILAGHNLNMPYAYENVFRYQEEPRYIDSRYGLLALDTDVLAVIAELLGLRGPCFMVGGACASGNLALLTALDTLRLGRADAVVVTGGASTLDFVMRQGWSLINALTIRSFNETPEQASRPFDARREGFVPSEGSGAIVLETLKSAEARGATIYAELLGAASTSSASRLTHPNLEAQTRVMQEALDDAGIVAEQVDCINAHATSTPAGDAVEVEAFKVVLGKHAYRIPVNSTKSMLGHCVTSSAILELIAVILQMQHGFVHPTINQTDPDPELDLDFVPNEARPYQMQIVLSNAFGFGGLNSSVVVGKAP